MSHQNQSGRVKNGFMACRSSKFGKIFASLAKFIGLERYQAPSNELEKLLIEAVCGNNYSRAVKDLERNGKLPAAVHTAHDWVIHSDCDKIKISPQTETGTDFSSGISAGLIGNVSVNIANCKYFSQNPEQ